MKIRGISSSIRSTLFRGFRPFRRWRYFWFIRHCCFSSNIGLWTAGKSGGELRFFLPVDWASCGYDVCGALLWGLQFIVSRTYILVQRVVNVRLGNRLHCCVRMRLLRPFAIFTFTANSVWGEGLLANSAGSFFKKNCFVLIGHFAEHVMCIIWLLFLGLWMCRRKVTFG